MTRFQSVFTVAVCSCTLAFAQSTNIIGNGTDIIDLSGAAFTGSGTLPTNYAAHVENVATLDGSGSTFDGGVGATTTGGTATTIEDGGNGLELETVGVATLSDTEGRGGAGGNVESGSAGAQVNISVNGGIGLKVNEVDEFSYIPGTEEVHIQNGTFEGGAGGTVIGMAQNTALDASGGAGASIAFGWTHLDSGSFTGGKGGTITSEGSSITANGGDGLLEAYDAVIVSLDENVSSRGGDGGTITDSEGGSTVSAVGGRGIYHLGLNYFDTNFTFAIDGGTYEGGSGGTVDNQGGTAITSADVSGGDGFFMQLQYAAVTNGTFVGGAGGTVNGAADAATADGGAGLNVLYNPSLEILGGTYRGGAAGWINGESGLEGAGLRVQDTFTTIRGGTFEGLGLWMQSRYTVDSTLDVHGGSFEDVKFDAGAGRLNTVTITGGSFNDLYIVGDGANQVTLGGTNITYNDLYLDSATADLALDATATGSGNVMQYSGTANITAWEDQHFMDTVIHDGSMNFSGQAFSLQGESSLELLGADSSATFNDGFTAQSNSMITTAYDKGSGASSTIEGSDLTFLEGTKWSIDGGDSPIASGDEITLAVASGSLSNSIVNTDVEYIGASGSWLAGISVDAVGTDLIGSYGYVSFDDALGVDDSTPFGQAMSDVSDFTDISNPTNNDKYLAIKSSNLTEAQSDGYLRSAFSSPEMANTLVRAQQLYSDQIRDRSRSYLRFKNVGAPAAPAPEGAAGLVDIPATYQLWARAYGAFVSQGAIDEFVGYDATIGGAVVGADKRFDNLLFGLGGGYTRSDLKGNYGSNGEADTVYGSIYSTMNGESAFLELQGTVAYNDVETQGSQVTGGYHGEFDAGTASFFIGTGIGLPVMKDRVIFTPEVSLLTTYYARDGYTEKQTTDPNAGNWPDKVYDSYDEMSYLSALGGTLAMHERFEALDLEMEFQPEIRAHWLHEFNDQMDNESYQMESLAGPYTPQQAVLQARQEDLIKLGLGVRFGKWDSDTFEFGLDLDAVFGDQYEAYIGSAKVMHRF